MVAEFKVHHYSVIDLLDDEDEDGIQEQQTVLDEHEDIVAQLTARLEKVMASSTAKDSNEPKVASKRLRAIERGLSSIVTGTSSLPPGDEDNICLLQQCDQQLSELKAEFLVIRNIIFCLDIDDHHELHDTWKDGRIFDCSVKIKKLLRSHSPPSTSSSDHIGIKLPKLEIPTFDGSILNWKTFWEQFSVSVDARSNLTDSEKLAYLRHALKGGNAKKACLDLANTIVRPLLA